MNQANILDTPEMYGQILAKSEEIGFTMPSDIYIGTLLKTLISSKSRAKVLELGTGIGLSLAWMIDGLDRESQLITVDNDSRLIDIVNGFFGSDSRLQILCEEGSQWIKNNSNEKFDLIFADAWPGKYSEIEEILAMVKVGGFYVIDDMLSQPNWPEGHSDLVDDLITYLESRKDFTMTKMNWSTGVILMTKKAIK